MDILSICPKLVALNKEGTLYRGFITVDKEDFLIQIKLDKSDDLSSARVDGEWKLWQLLRHHETVINQRLNHCTSLASFLMELKNILEGEVSSWRQKSRVVPLPHFYTQLIKDIETVGWHRMAFIDPTFREMHLASTDVGQRKHILKLYVDEYPNKCPAINADLPLPLVMQWTSRMSLVDIYRRFEDCIQQYQVFWDMLDEIDGSACILEPEKPTRSATYRRIALGKNLSVQIDVDPRLPRMIPDCRFLGADHLVAPIRENLNRNITQWNCNDTLLKNLQNVLVIEFPSPRTSKKEDFSSECGICYAYRLGDDIPDQSCGDPRCAQTFHNSCLSEWLRALPSTRQSFNVLFGECPYCGKSITVKVLTC